MTWLVSLGIALLFQAPQAQPPNTRKYMAWCEQGNQQVVTQGQNSTTRVQRSYPICTINVFNHGTTTHSQLFSNEQGTPLANPFMNQQQNTGQFFFYAAANGRYDIQIAAPGLTTYTLFDVTLNGPGPIGPNGPPGPPGPPGPGGGGGGGMNCGLTTVMPNDIPTCIQMTGGIAYPQWWGAKGDGVILGGEGGVGGCTGAVGSATISCTGASFAAGDVGKRFDLAHAGTPSCGPTTWGRGDLIMNCGLVGTITAVTSATTVTLSTNVLSAVTNEQFAYASSDDAAVQAAINSAAPTIALSGIYGITGPTTGYSLGNGAVGAVFKNRSMIGFGLGRLLRIGPIAWSGTHGPTLMIENGSENFIMQNVSIWGTNWLGELSQFGPGHDSLLICGGSPGSGICAGSPGNQNGSIKNISFIDCDMSHNWGIGLHGPGSLPPPNPGVYDITIRGGFYRYNSYDGLNPNPADGLIISAVNASYNGTGGLETATWGHIAITGSLFNHNKQGGMAAGGYVGAGHGASCVVSGNSFSENGNGVKMASQGSTAGVGAIFGDGVWNCAITGNTIRHNHLMGLQLTGDTNDENFTITGNMISSNGLPNETSGTAGIYGNFNHANVSNNTIFDENLVEIMHAQRTGNVVTVKTWLPFNLNPGSMVEIGNTPNGMFDGTFTVVSVPDETQFTFAQTGADTGLVNGGNARNLDSPFYQYYGMLIQNAINSHFVNNYVHNNWVANVAMASLFVYHNSTFASETNSTVSNRDIRLNGLVPSSAGMMLAIPDIQNMDTACMTGSGAGSTCTMTITDNMGFMNKATTCSFRDTPQPNAGFPVFLKAVPLNVNQTTVTIGHINGGAAGGGTIKCFTNFNYDQ